MTTGLVGPLTLGGAEDRPPSFTVRVGGRAGTTRCPGAREPAPWREGPKPYRD